MKAVITISALALALLGSPAWSQDKTGTIEYGQDRPGKDLYRVPLPMGSNFYNCQGVCFVYDNCRAWTFSRPDVVGATPYCFLKEAQPATNNNYCCVSGTFNRPPAAAAHD
jgi:hypothetical protein